MLFNYQYRNGLSYPFLYADMGKTASRCARKTGFRPARRRIQHARKHDRAFHISGLLYLLCVCRANLGDTYVISDRDHYPSRPRQITPIARECAHRTRTHTMEKWSNLYRSWPSACTRYFHCSICAGKCASCFGRRRELYWWTRANELASNEIVSTSMRRLEMRHVITNVNWKTHVIRSGAYITRHSLCSRE